jgi:hypothetical protein
MDGLLVLVAFVFGVVLCAFGAAMLRLGSVVAAGDRKIAAEGVDAEAVVTAHRTVPGRGSDLHQLTFAYQVPGTAGQPQRMSQEIEISEEDFRQLELGDKLPIRYLPSAPQEVILRGVAHDEGLRNALIGGVGGLVAGALLIILCVYTWLR